MIENSWKKLLARLVCGIVILAVVSSNSELFHHTEEVVRINYGFEQEDGANEQPEDQESFYLNQTLAFSPIIKTLPSPILFVEQLLAFNENTSEALKYKSGVEIPYVFQLFFIRCISPQAP